MERFLVDHTSVYACQERHIRNKLLVGLVKINKKSHFVNFQLTAAQDNFSASPFNKTLC